MGVEGVGALDSISGVLVGASIGDSEGLTAVGVGEAEVIGSPAGV